MAVNVAQKADKKLHTGTVTYPGIPEPLKVPRTPLESRQGSHPKKDYLVWRSPPSRQLTQEKRVEYQSDVHERFYDDYIGPRRTGDIGHEVLTGVHKLGFDPQYYRANALQGLAYDPARPVPAGVDFNSALQLERARERQRESERFRQRRLSDSFLLTKPALEYQSHQPHLEPLYPQRQLTGPLAPGVPQKRPRSALQKSLDESLNVDIVPAVENWLVGASKKEQEVATKFFRTLSSHGKRPDPAAKAALHSTRVRSAVLTPSRRQREEKLAHSTFQQLARETGAGEPSKPPPVKRHPRRSSSEKGITKGSMFAAMKQQPSHYTVHPDWASEGIDPYKTK